jgi:predicted metal-binding protein
MLIEYYRIKYNPDLKFAENYMEILGFKKCGCCNGNEEKRSFLNS